MSITLATLRGSWHSWISADMVRVGPYWLQLVWTALFGVVLAVLFTVFGFVAWAEEAKDWLELPRWRYWFGKNLIVTLVVGYTIHALFELIGWMVGGPDRIRRFRAWQRVLFFAGVPMLGMAIGVPPALWLAGAQRMMFFASDDGLRAILVSLAFWLIATFVIYQWFSVKARAIVAERRGTEAQLRLLQAQIEPHFLFNTLATVQSLIDQDPAKARRMLQAFTEHLRASLGQLRRDEGPLAHELDLAESYLQLMKARMEERLAYTISADDAARAVALPPLLLQPLVENAIQHGLEPTIAGGRVTIAARREGPALVITVQDDGRGPEAPPRRGGNGIALANIRERLSARYGDAASLTLEPAHPGTRATLRLPITAA